jgi:hypothetical protein
MRKYIDIVTEGEVVPFPQVNRPTNAMNAIHGGEVHRFAKRPLFFSLDSFTQGYIEAALWTDEDRLAEDG